MAENEPKKEEIPAFKISDKKVDDSWKEEVRREREAAAHAPATAAGRPGAQSREAAPRPKAESAPAEPAARAPDAGTAKEPAPKPTGTPAEQQASKIFMNFLAGLAQQALMQLGEIESPFSGQREVDLQGARYTIELLSVIEVRTKGNVTEDEAAALKDAIHDLRMRFVQVNQEVQRQMAAQAAQAMKANPSGGMRPGPGGSIGGKRR
jgi:hypothetical protein